MDKNYYIETYKRKWEECLKEAEIENSNDISEAATYIFEETANADEIVGYYLVYHRENALSDWRNNTEGIKMSSQDLKVDEILTRLFG